MRRRLVGEAAALISSGRGGRAADVMTKLERLLIPLFLAVLIGALALEKADAETVRRLAQWTGVGLLAFLLLGFVARYARHRRMTALLRDAERRAEEEAAKGTVQG